MTDLGSNSQVRQRILSPVCKSEHSLILLCLYFALVAGINDPDQCDFGEDWFTQLRVPDPDPSLGGHRGRDSAQLVTPTVANRQQCYLLAHGSGSAQSVMPITIQGSFSCVSQDSHPQTN